MLLAAVQKEIPAADQALVARVLVEIGKSEASVVADKQVGVFVERCRKAIGGIEVAKPQSASKKTVGVSAEQVRDRRNDATTTVLANASNQVSEILEEAAAKAQKMLADKKASTVDRLAAQMVASAEGEIDAAMGFLDQFMAGTGMLAIADFQGLLTVEAEVVG